MHNDLQPLMVFVSFVGLLLQLLFQYILENILHILLPFSVDTKPPTILGCPRDRSVNAEIGVRGKSVSWTEPGAEDLSGITTQLSRSHIPGSLFYPGQTLVTYIYTDPSHNIVACSFHINIVLGKERYHNKSE